MELESLTIEKTALTLHSFKYLNSILQGCDNLIALTLEDIMSMESLRNEEYGICFLNAIKNVAHLRYLKKLNISRNHLQNSTIASLVPIL